MSEIVSADLVWVVAAIACSRSGRVAVRAWKTSPSSRPSASPAGSRSRATRATTADSPCARGWPVTTSCPGGRSTCNQSPTASRARTRPLNRSPPRASARWPRPRSWMCSLTTSGACPSRGVGARIQPPGPGLSSQPCRHWPLAQQCLHEIAYAVGSQLVHRNERILPQVEQLRHVHGHLAGEQDGRTLLALSRSL